MFYIISPVPLSKIQEYEMPMLDSHNRDLLAFYNSEKGKEFYDIHPLVISQARNHDWDEVISDVMCCWVFYDCPLNVYILPDSLYPNMVKLQYSRHFSVPEWEYTFDKDKVKGRAIKNSPDFETVASLLLPLLKTVKFRPARVYEFKIDYYNRGESCDR